MTQNNFPANDALLSLAEGLAEAHRAYGKKEYVNTRFDDVGAPQLTLPPSARILFVVQAGERNVFDQRWLEYELLEKFVKFSLNILRGITFLSNLGTPPGWSV